MMSQFSSHVASLQCSILSWISVMDVRGMIRMSILVVQDMTVVNRDLVPNMVDIRIHIACQHRQKVHVTTQESSGEQYVHPPHVQLNVHLG